DEERGGEYDIHRADKNTRGHYDAHALTPPIRSSRTWICCTIPPESPSRRRQFLADLLEDRVLALEVGREKVWRGIRIADRPGEQPIFSKQVEVVANRSIVHFQSFAELVRVVRSFMQCLDDAGPIHTAAGAGNEVPQQLPQSRAHGGR